MSQYRWLQAIDMAWKMKYNNVHTSSMCHEFDSLLIEWYRFFFIFSDISNSPDPIINWYDYLTSRLHVMYENDLQEMSSMRKTLD